MIRERVVRWREQRARWREYGRGNTAWAFAVYSSSVELALRRPRIIVSGLWFGFACVLLDVWAPGRQDPRMQQRRVGRGLFLGVRLSRPRLSAVLAIRSGSREHFMDIEINF